MQGIKRKIVYVALYEAIAIASITAAMTWISGQDAGHAGVLAVASSIIAITWNLIYNTLFEAWEARQPTRGRSLGRRIAHAVGFQGVMMLIGIPLYAWWLAVSLAQAFMLNIGMIVFFLVYSFCYNWVFDLVFGLPASAQARLEADPRPAAST